MSKPSCYLTSYPDQLSVAIHLWVDAMSTSKSLVVIRQVVYINADTPLSVASQCKLVLKATETEINIAL